MKLKKDQIAPWGKELLVIQTGEWRSERPILNRRRCNHCGQCWIVCPTFCIHAKEGAGFEIDLSFCKGCGLCAKECMFGAIHMEREQKE